MVWWCWVVSYGEAAGVTVILSELPGTIGIRFFGDTNAFQGKGRMGLSLERMGWVSEAREV